MIRPIDAYYERQEEPAKSCMLFLRMHIAAMHPEITEEWKYGMPFFYLQGKMFCYLWIHKKYRQPYIGIVDGAKVDHPDLLHEKRARMKILLIDPQKEIPVHTINQLLRTLIGDK